MRTDTDSMESMPESKYPWPKLLLRVRGSTRTPQSFSATERTALMLLPHIC